MFLADGDIKFAAKNQKSVAQYIVRWPTGNLSLYIGSSNKRLALAVAKFSDLVRLRTATTE